MEVTETGGEVGVLPEARALDAPRKELTDLYRRIAGACDIGDGASRVRERTRTFLLYARWHFAEEEKGMRAVAYPNVAAHKAEHDRLLQDAEDFIESVGGGLHGADCLAIARYFRFWLNRHSAGPDRSFAEFLVTRDSAPAEPARRVCETEKPL